MYESNHYTLSSKYLYQKILLNMHTFFQWFISLQSLEDALLVFITLLKTGLLVALLGTDIYCLSFKIAE